MPQRKAEIVSAVNDGVLTLDEACRRYSLSPEEFLSWKAALETYGLVGLRRGYGRSPTRPKRSRVASPANSSFEMSL